MEEIELTPEEEQTMNQRNDALIEKWASWEMENWECRFKEGEDEEEYRGKLEQLHRTAVIALAQHREAQARLKVARALNEQFNPTAHLRIRQDEWKKQVPQPRVSEPEE